MVFKGKDKRSKLNFTQDKWNFGVPHGVVRPGWAIMRAKLYNAKYEFQAVL